MNSRYWALRAARLDASETDRNFLKSKLRKDKDSEEDNLLRLRAKKASIALRKS